MKTKKPKRVNVKWQKIEPVYYRSEYRCPACQRVIIGHLRDQHVTRFLCACGQELIVDKEVEIVDSALAERKGE